MTWIWKIGLSQSEASEEQLKKAGLKYEMVIVEDALRKHIPETLGKPYKFFTSMREDAPQFFSCSSLISYLYTFAGIWMPSLVIDKFFFAKPIEKNELRFGDLIFSFANGAQGDHPARSTSVEYMPGKLKSEKPITHVGMYIDNNEVLHAAGLDYGGKVIAETLSESSCFKNIAGYGRVAEDLDERRLVVEIPDDRQDLRNRDALLAEVSRFAAK